MADKDQKVTDGERVTVFEAVNQTTKELFIGTTTLGMHEIIAQHRDDPPPAIAHWKKDHNVNYRSVEFNMRAKEAEQFVENYARTTPSGWKVIRQSA